MVPENCPYAALSRTLRALSHPSRIRTWDNDQVFVCKFVTKISRRIVFKNITDWRSVFKAALVTFLLCVMSLFQSTESMALGKSVLREDVWLLDIGFAPILWKAFEAATLQKELAHFGPGVGSGRIHLSRTFRGPFANLSRISRLKNEISETKCLCKGVFYNLCQSCRVPLPIVRTWDNTKHESCGNSARKTAKYEYYIFINSGIQTFRRPYAALSRPFATAAKHTHPYLQMSLGY